MRRVESMFDDLGMPVVRYDAITPDRASVHPIVGSLPQRKYREWSPSELGCLLSHYDLWLRIAEGDHAHAAIFEDDIHVSSRLPDLLNSSVPSDIDILKLETTLLETRIANHGRRLVNDVQAFRLKGLHTGGGGYILSSRAAAVLVAGVALFDQPADHLLFEPGHPVSKSLKVFQVLPALVVQDCVLPEDEQSKGFLSSAMVDRPVFHKPAQEPRGLSRTLKSIGLAAPGRALMQTIRSLTSRSLIVPYGGQLYKSAAPAA